MRKLIQSGAALGVLLALGSIRAANAQGVTVGLDTLLVPGATLKVDDKVFSDFTYSATGDMPAAAAVNVNGFIDGSEECVRFQGGFTDVPGGGASDALITYTVTSLGGLIVDAEIRGNPDVVGGTGVAAVTDTFTQLPNISIGIGDTASIDPLTGALVHNKTTFQHIDFAGVQKLNVQKDIIMDSGTGTATLSFVDQCVSQQTVPEPGTLALMGTGALGLLPMLRRRRA